MIGLLITAAMLAQTAPPSVVDSQAEVERAVQAMNERLNEWSASIDTSGSLDTCKTIQSSGDPQLDALACQAMSDCAIKMQSIAAQLEDPSVSDVKKSKLVRKASGIVTTCVSNRRLELFKDLAKSRLQAAERTQSK